MTRRAFQDLQAGYQPVLAFPPEPGALDLQGSGKTLGVGGGCFTDHAAAEPLG